MKNIYIPCCYKRANRGMILVLMLVLAALTSLLATSNIERTKQRILLDSALVIRVQSDELLMRALQRGIAYAENNLRMEDFDVAHRGIYKTVATERIKSDYRRATRPLTDLDSGMDAGFSIELFSEGSTIQTAQNRVYLNCRLLVSAYIESPDIPLSFSQALVETALPTIKTPTTNTDVVMVTTLADTEIIATRILK